MLDELIGVMERTHCRRRTRRRALTGAAGTCVLFALLWLALPGLLAPVDKTEIAQQTHTPRMQIPMPPSTAHERRTAVVVQTDPGILERCRARPTGAVVHMDDGLLLQTLASINRPAGLIRMGDRVLLSAPVTDAELSLSQ
jgi:hypothetical protein